MDFLKLLLNNLLVFQLFHFSASSIDTITANHSIKDGDVIVSEQKIFALGFFSPGNSPKRYVGIWYHQISGYQIPEKTVVWVANRDHPISGKTGVLSINTHGNLVLYETNLSSVSLWSTNVSFTSLNGTVAQLSDSGNLVLRLVENSSKHLWESFDYPTDTLLPLMKFGLDKKRGLNRILRSWKSPDDPGSGEYSRMIDPTGNPQLITYKGSNKWWRAGSWTGKGWSGVPERSRRPNPEFTFVNNQTEVFYMLNAEDPPGLSRLEINESGHVCRFRWDSQEKNWNLIWIGPRDLQCDYYGHCGANSNCNRYQSNVDECVCLPGFEPKYPQGDSGNRSRGCMRKRGMSSCQRGRRFIRVPQVKVPDTSVTLVDMSLDLNECKNKCLSNCSCIAYTSAQPETDGVMGCLTYHGEMMDTRSYTSFGQDLYVRVPDESDGSPGKKAIVAIVIASLFAMFLMIVATTWSFRRKRRERAREITISLTSANLGELFDRKEQNLQVFDLKTIVAATNNFSSENKLGEGGFGPVYKGQLSNGQEIAVKRLSLKSEQGISEFKNEVSLIAKLQHRNLVCLLGYCIEQEEKMLIYEFMPNKSLDYFIFDQSRKLLLDWKMRFEIILGIARGILYLHQDSRLKVIHRDLKTSNILLDEEMKPKISDFGTAKIFGGNQSQGNTKKVVGTHGYMSPEYVMDGFFSPKSDIFSFGVIVLEIISGKKNRGFFLDDPSSYLIQYTWELWKNGKALEIVDSCMVDQFPANEVLRCIQVGLLCVQDNAKDRPNLSTAIFMLSNETVLPSPKKPTFVLKKNEPETSISGTKYSINEVTITTLDAR